MKYLFLFFLLFSITIFARPLLFGIDSYYYAALSCGKIEPFTVDNGVNSFFFHLIPCDYLAFRLVIVLIFVFSLFLFYKIAALFDKKNAEILSLIFFMGLSSISYFANFENDLIAAPFLLCSLYFFTKYSLDKKIKNYFFALTLALIGILIWKMLALWFLFLLSASIAGLLLSSAIFIVFSDQILTSIDFRIVENSPSIGLLSPIFLLFGMKDLPFSFWIPTIISIFFTFLSIKFALFSGLFFSIGAIAFLVRKNYLNDPKKRNIIIGVLIVFLVMQLPNIFLSTPKKETLDLIRTAADRANGRVIENDFWVGYFILDQGGIPSRVGGLPDPDFNVLKGIKITEKCLACPVFGTITEQNNPLIIPKIAFLYDCG